MTNLNDVLELLRRNFASGGAMDYRNMGMALPFARQAAATPALASRFLNTPERIKELAQQRYDEKIEKMYQAAKQWYQKSNIPQMPEKDLKSWLRQQAPQQAPNIGYNQPRGLDNLGNALGAAGMSEGQMMGQQMQPQPQMAQQGPPQIDQGINEIPQPMQRGGGTIMPLMQMAQQFGPQMAQQVRQMGHPLDQLSQLTRMLEAQYKTDL